MRDFAGFAGFCVGEGRLAWGLVGCRVARSHQGATLQCGSVGTVASVERAGWQCGSVGKVASAERAG